MKNPQPTVERLRELFSYDPETGVLTHKPIPDAALAGVGRRASWNTRFAGRPVKANPHKGYLRIRVDGKNLRLHRVAWALHYGKWPDGDIDHKNTIRTDNWIDNLRDATKSINNQNLRAAKAHNKSTGLLGVTYHKRDKKFIAQIFVGGKTIQVLRSNDPNEAHEAYLAAKRRLHAGCTI